MSFNEFKDWYKKQSGLAGMDLGGYLGMAGVETGTLGQMQGALQRGAGGATGAPVPFTAGSNIKDFAGADYLGDEGELYWLNRQGGTNYGSLDEAKNAMALAAGMAGVTNWNANLAGVDLPGGGRAERGNLPGYLTNVRPQDIRYDPASYELMLNALVGMNPKDAQARIKAQQALVQPWMTEVDQALRGQVDINREGTTGIPFGFEMLMDPTINLTGKGPLFGTDMPSNLFGLHMGQGAEADVLRSASVQELMQHIWPIAHAQYHQPAGAAAPFEAGLTFGNPQLDPQTGMYTRSPIMGWSNPEDYSVDPDLIRLEGYAGQSVPSDELYRNVAGGIYGRYQTQQASAGSAVPQRAAQRSSGCCRQRKRSSGVTRSTRRSRTSTRRRWRGSWRCSASRPGSEMTHTAGYGG